MTAAQRSLLAAASARPTWNQYVASLVPYAWWKLDEDTFAVEGNNTVQDASGNGRTGLYVGDSTPTRHQTALVTGSAYAVTIGNGLALALRQTSASILGGLTTGSFTLGFWIKTTATGQQQDYIKGSTNYFWIGLNNTWDGAGAAAPGKVSWLASTSGLNLHGLTTPDIAFNDGNEHLLMFEYDSVGDTISIWFDGTRVAGPFTQVGVTMPTGHTTSTYGQQIASTLDEWLFFDKVLTAAQHAALASYAA